MKIKVGELEKTYRGMNEEDFENVDWLDLTEEAKLVYERELQRRLPSQWHDVIEERKELLAMSALDRPTESVLSAEGRLSRQDYALRVFSVDAGVIALFLLARLAASVGGNSPGDGIAGTGINLPNFAAFAAILIGLGFAGSAMIVVQAIKRFHDLDRPGSHVLLLFVPLYGLYLSFLLLFKKGTAGANRYGKDPAAEQTVSLGFNLRDQAPQR